MERVLCPIEPVEPRGWQRASRLFEFYKPEQIPNCFIQRSHCRTEFSIKENPTSPRMARDAYSGFALKPLFEQLSVQKIGAASSRASIRSRTHHGRAGSSRSPSHSPPASAPTPPNPQAGRRYSELPPARASSKPNRDKTQQLNSPPGEISRELNQHQRHQNAPGD